MSPPWRGPIRARASNRSDADWQEEVEDVDDNEPAVDTQAVFEKHLASYQSREGQASQQKVPAGQASEAPPAEAPAEAAPEAQPEQAAQEAPQDQPEEEMAEFFGDKVPAKTASKMNAYFTQKNQAIAEERRQADARLAAERKALEDQKKELLEYRRKLDEWVKKNPEVAAKKEDHDLKAQIQATQQRLDTIEQERLFQQNMQALEEACEGAEKKFPLPPEATITEDDYRSLYLQEFKNGDGAVSVEEAAAKVRERIVKSAKSKQSAKVQELAAKKQQQATPKPNTGAASATVTATGFRDQTRKIMREKGPAEAWAYLDKIQSSFIK